MIKSKHQQHFRANYCKHQIFQKFICRRSFLSLLNSKMCSLVKSGTHIAMWIVWTWAKTLRTAFKVSIKCVLFLILFSFSRNCVRNEEKNTESSEKCQHNYNHMQQISWTKYLWKNLSDMEEYLSTTEYISLI